MNQTKMNQTTKPSRDQRMTFGEALECLKEGKLLTRSGWNGNDMFIFIRPSVDIDIYDIENVKSLPNTVKAYYKQDIIDYNVTISTPSDTLDLIHFTPYVCMKNADGDIINGWVASQSDMLANDWEIFYF